jgi:hypothetical protein
VLVEGSKAGRPKPESKSSRRLARNVHGCGFLAIVTLPVVLVLGPCHDAFFLPQHEELAAVAQPGIPLAWEPRLAGLDLAPRQVEQIRERLDAANHFGLGELLDRMPATPTIPELALLRAHAYLLQNRPAPVALMLEDFRRNPHPTLDADATWLLAQSYLLLGRAELAGACLDRLVDQDGPWSAAVRQQRDELARIGRDAER